MQLSRALDEVNRRNSARGLHFLGNLLPTESGNPPGPGCARFRMEARDKYSGLWSHKQCGSIQCVGEGPRGSLMDP